MERRLGRGGEDSILLEKYGILLEIICMLQSIPCTTGTRCLQSVFICTSCDRFFLPNDVVCVLQKNIQKTFNRKLKTNTTEHTKNIANTYRYKLYIWYIHAAVVYWSGVCMYMLLICRRYCSSPSALASAPLQLSRGGVWSRLRNANANNNKNGRCRGEG